MVYACPAWEDVVDGHLLKLKCLQNCFLHSIDNFDRCTLVHEMHTVFRILLCIQLHNKTCRKQAEAITNHLTLNVHATG